MSPLAVLSLVGLLGPSGCDDTSADETVGGPSTLDAGIDSGGGPVSAGDGGSAAAPTCNDGKWVHGGWITTQDTEKGYLNVLGDLRANAQVDLAKVQSFDGNITYSAYSDAVAFVGTEDSSTLQRWQLESDGRWTKTAEGELRNQGVTSTSGDVHRVNDSKAYYFDTENNQIVGFNPATMLHNGVIIDLKPGLGEPGDFMSLSRVHRSGDVFIVAARYWNPDYSVKKIIQAAFIDSTNDSVTFAEETRCGGVYYNATDAAGNLYLGAHVSNLFDRVEGTTSEASDSCIVRIKKGEKKFDAEYYVDMQKLLGGMGATLIDGPGDMAFIEKYEGPQLTKDNFAAARLGANWDVYSLTLGDEANTVAKVQLPSRTIAYGNGFVTRCAGRETGFLVMAGDDFASGQLFQVTTPTTVEAGLKYTGSIGEVTRLD